MQTKSRDSPVPAVIPEPRCWRCGSEDNLQRRSNHDERTHMAPRTTSAALNIQPRQRREVYHALGKVPAGRSVQDLLTEVDMPEHDLRESLRKLDAAGLAERSRGTWRAVSSDGGDPEISRD